MKADRIVTDKEATDLRVLVDIWLGGDQSKRTWGKLVRDLLDTRDELKQALLLVLASTLVSNDEHDLWSCDEFSCRNGRSVIARLRGES
jgi:hypothetical protein